MTREQRLEEALLGIVAITRTWQQMRLDARKVPLADLCWCGDRGEWPVEHQPYCDAARAALAVPEEPAADEAMRLRYVLARIAITRRGASSPEVYEETIRRWADDALAVSRGEEPPARDKGAWPLCSDPRCPHRGHHHMPTVESAAQHYDSAPAPSSGTPDAPRCPECWGDGYVNAERTKKCPTCGGSGLAPGAREGGGA